MPTIPKKVQERLVKELPRFQKILQNAKDRDINESDTVIIIMDVLASIFGYEKYSEVTSEFAIRSTFCDLAIKIDGVLKYLIEVKAIGTTLKENHLRQAVDYGANQGVDWVVLTNGVCWDIYKIKFDKPVSYNLICRFSLLDMNGKKAQDQDSLFLLCKEGLSKAAIEEYHDHQMVVNRFVIAALLGTETVVDVVRRELRRIEPSVRVENEEIEAIIRNEVLKRDVTDGEAADKARSTVKRAANKALRKAKEASETSKPAGSPPSDACSPDIVEQLNEN